MGSRNTVKSKSINQAARELAIAAGHDPDERVQRLGGKAMPIWCTFIDQAKANASMLEAELNAPANTRPQDAKYQNSPIKVIGEHDEQTIAQMKNCMQTGNAVAGVICADGHFGYAQPVGGVIAYEKQISISGVGFDIGCVDAETEFLTENGWVRMDKWNNHKVAQYDPKTGIASFVTPLAYIDKAATSFLHFKTKYGMDMMLSPDHRVLVYVPGGADREYLEYKVISAREYFDRQHEKVNGTDWRINTSFNINRNSKLPYSDLELSIIVMTCADGHLITRRSKANELSDTSTVSLSFKKERKIVRARELLNQAGILISERGPDSKGYTHFRYKTPLSTKTLGSLWNASTEQLKLIAEEVLLWGGNTKDQVFFSTDKASADFVHYAFATTGWRSVMREDFDSGYNRNDYRVFAQPNTKVAPNSSPKTLFKEYECNKGERQYCFTVPTGFFVIRRGGNIAITGNCGNMAVRLDTKYESIKYDVANILKDITNVISFGVGRTNNKNVSHELFDDSDAWHKADTEEYRKKAVEQLGTVGGGNHYVDLFEDDSGFVWIGVHFGSRGLGHTSATRYLKAAGGKEGMMVAPAVVDEDSELGMRYIAAMELAGRYSYAGREWVCEQVRQLIGGKVTDTVHNHHNFAFREKHFINGEEKDLWVVRKGATPAFPGQRGFVGGSMGDNAVILEGVDSQESKDSLYSTVHGAGRLFGRMQAKRTFTRAQMDQWMNDKGILVAGGDVDESPFAYRRLPDVLKYHAASTKILHQLRPFAVAMAPEKINDPFKD
jgi:tRNA-splicing ligase RtcB